MNTLRWYTCNDGKTALQSYISDNWVDVPSIVDNTTYPVEAKGWKDWLNEQTAHDKTEYIPEPNENNLDCTNITTVSILREDSIYSSIELVAFIETKTGSIKADTETIWLTIKNIDSEIDETWDNPTWVNTFLHKVDKYNKKYGKGALRSKIRELLKTVDILDQNGALTNYICEHIDNFASVYKDGIKCGILQAKSQRKEP